MPGSDALCRERLAGQGADTPATYIRVGTVSTRTAPAFGRALAPWDGSDLLPLRLLLFLQLGDAVFRAAPIRNVYELCQARSFPAISFPLRARSCERPGPFGGVDPPGNAIACWYYRSSHNPLGDGISSEIETVSGPDSVRARFLNSRLTAQLLIRV
jgi:hypothetical protein